jgi:pimeloyl-ACP methyl ester carboxylesterase
MSGSTPEASAAVAMPDAWCRAALGRTGRSSFVEVNGSSIHYLTWGSERADKPVLVLVHGFRGHAHWWDVIAPYFADRYRVIALDLSGMGDSAHRSIYEATTFAEDVIGVIEHAASTPVTIVAHSFGGSRSLQACGLRPELFSRAIIVDSYFVLGGEAVPVVPPVRGDRIYPDLQSAMSRFRLIPKQPLWTPLLLQHLARHSVREVSRGWTWKFDLKLPNVPHFGHSDESILRQVSTPVHFVYGEHSGVVDVERAHRIVAALSNGTGPIVIPEAHHHVMLDQPLALISALRALLA